MSKILVTGGAGFIGFHLAKKLAESSNNEVHICDDLSKGRLDNTLKSLIDRANVTFFHIDLADPNAFAQLDDDYNQIYHLAAALGVTYTDHAPDNVIRVNTLSTVYLLEWAKKLGAKILFSSTPENYAGGRALGLISIPTPEAVSLVITDPYVPRYSYAASKILGEVAMLNYSRVYGFETCIVRYHNIYGPRMGVAHVIPKLSLSILAKEDPLNLYGAQQTRTFCYVDDAVAATIAVMESEVTDQDIINIGDDRDELTIRELAMMLLDIADYHPLKINDLPPPLGSTDRRCPDISKLKQLVGYSPKTGLQEGLTKTFHSIKCFTT